MPRHDHRRHALVGWTIVLVGVAGFLLWAALAPLDQGIVSPGTVVVSGNRKSIQHPTGGIVDGILVKDGDTVRAGQVLVRMNDTQARSQAEIIRTQYYNALAIQARLSAESDGGTDIALPEPLLADRSDPRAANAIALQRQLFLSRKTALDAELRALDESLAGTKAQLAGTQEARVAREAQRAALKEQLDAIRGLAAQGYVPRTRLLDMERLLAQINGDIATDVGNIGRMQRLVAEMRLRVVQRKAEYQKEVRTQLADTQQSVDGLRSRLEALDFELSNTQLRAPADGTVVGLNVFTSGAVIAAGAKLMDIVPEREPLEVESQLAVNLVDKVHPKLQVELRFTAFNQNATPKVPGEVSTISADRLIDDKTGIPFYRMRASVTPEGMKMLRGLQIRPGMPVEMFVVTGERTLMSYLMKPIFDRAHSAMTEQ